MAIENNIEEETSSGVSLPPTPPATETPLPTQSPTPSINQLMPPTPPATGVVELTEEATLETVDLEEQQEEWHGEVQEIETTSTPEPTPTFLPPTPTPTFEHDYLLMDAIESYLQDYLHQVYFVDSILKISSKVIENERAIKEAFEKADSFIEADAWIACARDAVQAFKPFNKTGFGEEDLKN